MSDLFKKEQQAIRLLKQAGDIDFELAYSGGKDSDVILHLARVAGIKFEPIHKCTTIDPPYTLTHCKNNGATIIHPKKTFFQLVRKKGFPTRRARFCCEYLKEYKVKDKAILGIRADESNKRKKRYKEPTICRVYNKNDKVEQFLPILTWTNEDIKEYILSNSIQLHPLYYDEYGNLDITKRLGCIGCPLKADNGLADFKLYPKFAKKMIQCNQERMDNNPNLQVHKLFANAYELFYHNVFCDNYGDFLTNFKAASMFGERNAKEELENLFKIEL